MVNVQQWQKYSKWESNGYWNCEIDAINKAFTGPQSKMNISPRCWTELCAQSAVVLTMIRRSQKLSCFFLCASIEEQYWIYISWNCQINYSTGKLSLLLRDFITISRNTVDSRHLTKLHFHIFLFHTLPLTKRPGNTARCQQGHNEEEDY